MKDLPNGLIIVGNRQHAHYINVKTGSYFHKCDQLNAYARTHVVRSWLDP